MMGSNKDSFLEMIGLSSEEVREEDNFVSEEHFDEAPQPDETTGEVERPPYASQYSQIDKDGEISERDFDHPDDEIFDEATEFLDEAESEEFNKEVIEVSKTEPDPSALSGLFDESSTHEMSKGFGAPASAKSFSDFVTRQETSADKTEISEKTEAYGENTDFEDSPTSTDAHAILRELEVDGSMEDALLDGLEEAEASRATDIFAQSYRADSRKTRARGQADEDADFFEDFDLPEEDDELDELIAEHKAEKELPTDLIIEDSSALGLEAEAVAEANHASEYDSNDEAIVDKYLSQVDQNEEAVSNVQYEEDQIAEDLFESEDSAEAPTHDKVPHYDPVLDHDPYMTQDSVKAQMPTDDEGTVELGRETMAFQYDAESQVKGNSTPVSLLGLEGPVASQSFALVHFPATLGRDPGNELNLDDQNVSRFHAEIHEHNGAYKIIDNNSTNGVKVNGALVEEKKLFDHDVVQIGDCIFEFLDPSSKSGGMKQDDALQKTIVQTNAGRGKFKRRLRLTKRTKIIALASVVGIASLVLLAGPLSRLGSEMGSNVAKGLVSEVGVNLLRDQVEKEIGLPLSQAEPEAVKQAVIGVMSDIPVLSLSQADLEALSGINADLYQAVLVDPDLYAAFQKNPLDFSEKRQIIAEKFQVALRTGDDKEALKWNELLLKINPSNEALKAQHAKLKSSLSYVETPKKPDLSEEDEAAFVRVMNDHRKRVEEYIKAGRLDSAIDLAKKVQERIVSLVNKRPEFSDFASAAIAEWKSKVSYLQRKQTEEKKERREERIAYKNSLKELEAIIQTYHRGEFTEALAQADQFQKKYPDHQKIDRIDEIKRQIKEDISAEFKLLEENVKRNMDIENFKLAWVSVYRFLDLLPGHQQALLLKQTLQDETKFKAQDLYNKARVYEVEAGDLLSAEQAYRKALELSDPRSDLSAKIERGYQKVRRKNLQ